MEMVSLRLTKFNHIQAQRHMKASSIGLTFANESTNGAHNESEDETTITSSAREGPLWTLQGTITLSSFSAKVLVSLVSHGSHRQSQAVTGSHAATSISTGEPNLFSSFLIIIADLFYITNIRTFKPSNHQTFNHCFYQINHQIPHHNPKYHHVFQNQ